MFKSQLKLMALIALCSLPLSNLFAECVNLTGTYSCNNFTIGIDTKTDTEGNRIYKFSVLSSQGKMTETSFTADGTPYSMDTPQGKLKYMAFCTASNMKIVFIKPGAQETDADHPYVWIRNHSLNGDNELSGSFTLGKMLHEKIDSLEMLLNHPRNRSFSCTRSG